MATTRFPGARVRRWVAAAAALAAVPTAQAATVRYDFTGVVNSAAPETKVNPGDKFWGSFTYDPDAAKVLGVSTSGPAALGSTPYYFGHADTVTGSIADDAGLDLQVGNQTGYTLQGGLGLTVAGTGSPGSPSGVTISNANVDGSSIGVALALVNPGEPVVTSATVPEKLDLANFPQATLTVTSAASGKTSSLLYSGTIDSLTLEGNGAPIDPLIATTTAVDVNAVPEPAAIATWLGLTVVGGLTWARRR